MIFNYDSFTCKISISCCSFTQQLNWMEIFLSWIVKKLILHSSTMYVVSKPIAFLMFEHYLILNCYAYRNPFKNNKRPMGHIAHLRKQFKSINTYDYIIMLIMRRKKTLLTSWEFIGSSFEQTWIPFTEADALCLVWLKLAQWFWRRSFLKVVNLFY